jgi:hypothetical protein
MSNGPATDVVTPGPREEEKAVKRLRYKLAFAITTAAVLGFGAVALADGGNDIEERLTGFKEVPALSTPGVGEFKASISPSDQEIRYQLTFSRLESDVTQAHIHFENKTNNGAIVVFLCSNLPDPPAGTQLCPPAGVTLSGTIRPADVGPLAEAQGIAAGEFQEFVRAIRAGATYVNVHSVGRPSGEIRAQLTGNGGDHHDHDSD